MRHFVLSFSRSLYIAVLLLATHAQAQAADDATIEQRVQRITQELGCVVCMSQTVADSRTELAILLKQQVRDMLTQGMSDQQALDFMMQHYGDFVLYRMPPKSAAWQLWFSPFLLLLFGWAFPLIKSRLTRMPTINESASKTVQ